jgi:hypothetical protein
MKLSAIGLFGTLFVFFGAIGFIGSSNKSISTLIIAGTIIILGIIMLCINEKNNKLKEVNQ